MFELTSCESYILNERNIQNYLKYKLNDINDNNKNKNNNNSNQKISTFFIPREQDTLFWCYYLIKNGDIQYELLKNRNLLTTKQFKIDLISKIRDNKQIVKTYKFDTITNIESNLANDNTLSIKTFMSLCAIDNLNIIFVSKKTYYEFLNNDSNVIYIIREEIHKSGYDKKYGYEIADEKMLSEIRDQLYKIEIIDKPIKALSSYKVSELMDIANKLAIETVNNNIGKNKTKNELYESIAKYF
jgi:hypothetical protein